MLRRWEALMHEQSGADAAARARARGQSLGRGKSPNPAPLPSGDRLHPSALIMRIRLEEDSRENFSLVPGEMGTGFLALHWKSHPFFPSILNFQHIHVRLVHS